MSVFDAMLTVKALVKKVEQLSEQVYFPSPYSENTLLFIKISEEKGKQCEQELSNDRHFHDSLRL